MAAILGGFALRLPLLDRFPFHPDEAIYSYWALRWWPTDPLFLEIWPDKPPLFLWLLAGTFQLFGVGEASARWLNVVISTLTIPVVGAIAHHLWRERAALIAICLYTLSPFAISFAPTAFTDPLLVLAGSLALLYQVTGRALWSGIWLGIAIMTKQQGVFYGPLILLSFSLQPTAQWQERAAQSARVLIGLAAVILPLLYWDSLRWTVAPSPWDLSIRNYGALSVVPIAGWGARAQEWGALLWYLVDSTAGWWMFAGFGILFAVRRQWQTCSTTSPEGDAAHIPYLLIGWSILFLVAHIVTSMPAWDRYLLPIAPMWVLLGGWVGANLMESTRQTYRAIFLGVLALSLLIPPALRATTGRIPIGGDHGSYSGLHEALQQVRQEAEGPFVLYHHALGWHYRFLLYEAVEQGEVELRWYPHGVYLADNAVKIPHRRKLLLLPAWEPMRDLDVRLAERGLALRELGRSGQFTAAEIVTKKAAVCADCYCGKATWGEFPHPHTQPPFCSRARLLCLATEAE